MHLDPHTTVTGALAVRHHPQQKATARRHTVYQRVGGEFADAQQHIVLAPAHAPLRKHPARERPRVGHGPTLTPKEPLKREGSLRQG